MHTTQLRHDAILGLIAGVAIGDALGYPYIGVSRQETVRLLGKQPLQYQLLPKPTICTEYTQLTLMAAQAVLRSRSSCRAFCQVFLHRLAWYPFSLPALTERQTLSLAYRGWLRRLGACTEPRTSSEPATRAMLLALVLHGTEHSVAKWVTDSTLLTHHDPGVVNACLVISKLTEISARKKGEFDSELALKQIVSIAATEHFGDRLHELQTLLQARRNPREVARHFGWEDAIESQIVPTTVMAIYCFLRYPHSFDQAVGSALRLGGNTNALAALVGGMVGSRIGYQQLPPELTRNAFPFPCGKQWISKLGLRLSHWPHGAEDIASAPALLSLPPLQLLRNLAAHSLVILSYAINLESTLAKAFSQRSGDQKPD